jgi:uncharacterized protein YecT (DUF1311 family)
MRLACPSLLSVTPGLTRGSAAFGWRQEAKPRIKSGATGRVTSRLGRVTQVLILIACASPVLAAPINSSRVEQCPKKDVGAWRECILGLQNETSKVEKAQFRRARSELTKQLAAHFKEMDLPASFDEYLDAFDRSEAAWSEYRKHACAAKSGRAAESTAQGYVEAICEVEMNQARIQELKGF